MKYICASLLALSAVNAELVYTPNNDVTAHSKMGLDQLDIKALIDGGDLAGAYEIYINGANREGKSLQGMATKDWAGAGIKDLSEYDAYAALFNQGDSEPFLDSYNRDAMNCDRSFAGSSPDMCKIAAKKNLLCTGLQYAQYEGMKATQNGDEKNWDELFAFWNGVYDETIDDRVNSGTPGAVQASRDSDFDTKFRDAALQALIDGQKAFKTSNVDYPALEEAYTNFKKANLATFAQATLKYSGIFDEPGLTQDKIDKKWGEGYTYFRCGAGLMDPELALYINYVLDPRDKLEMELTPKQTMCKIAVKMLSLPEIGMGVQMKDLNIEAYAPLKTIQADCDLLSLEHIEGLAVKEAKKQDSNRSWIPIIGFLIVIGIYGGGFYSFRGKKNQSE